MPQPAPSRSQKSAQFTAKPHFRQPENAYNPRRLAAPSAKCALRQGQINAHAKAPHLPLSPTLPR
ncbi:hypothetical protein [Kingella oralis]|uniref:hypothetical protein n=1 Tax=Kingella oralis TaxID=505 RepID=UPI0034E379EA